MDINKNQEVICKMEEEKVDLSFGSCTIRGASSGEYRRKQLYLGMKMQRIDDELKKRIKGISPTTKLSGRQRLINNYTDEADVLKADLGVRETFELIANHLTAYKFEGNPEREDLPEYLMRRGEDDIALIEQVLKKLSSVSEGEVKNSGGLSSKGRKSKTPS